jgi:hypothetical protein
MAAIGDLLQKYREQIEQNKDERGRLIEIVESICGLKLTHNEIDFEQGRLTFRTHPAKRQIIFMRKVELLSILQSEFPEKRIFDLY